MKYFIIIFILLVFFTCSICVEVTTTQTIFLMHNKTKLNEVQPTYSPIFMISKTESQIDPNDSVSPANIKAFFQSSDKSLYKKVNQKFVDGLISFFKSFFG